MTASEAPLNWWCSRAPVAAQRRVAADGVGLAAPQRGGREVVRADLDPPADRPRARGDGVELRAQPVRRGLGVGVGGGDQAVGREALRGEVHALAARVADARVGGLEHVQRHVARRRRGRAASVASVQRSSTSRTSYVGAARRPPGAASARDAGADQLLLVARGDDDAGLHGSGAPVSISSRPAS